MFLLLWSQLALAAHPACVEMKLAAPPATAMPGCGHELPAQPDPVCTTHCSQGDVSSDVARVPPVPPQAAMPAFGFVPLIAAAQAAALVPVGIEGPPLVSWHRPTAHPAALLLI